VSGWTAEEYRRKSAEQGGVCQICKSPPRGKKSLHADHDHETGERRDLLCQNCNVALGLVGEDPARLLALIDYLKRWGK
jgi:hypothetical protein